MLWGSGAKTLIIHLPVHSISFVGLLKSSVHKISSLDVLGAEACFLVFAFVGHLGRIGALFAFVDDVVDDTFAFVDDKYQLSKLCLQVSTEWSSSGRLLRIIGFPIRRAQRRVRPGLRFFESVTKYISLCTMHGRQSDWHIIR